MFEYVLFPDKFKSLFWLCSIVNILLAYKKVVQ